MDLPVAWPKKGGAALAGKYLADWVQGRVWRGVPNFQGRRSILIDRSLHSANGAALSPHGLPQALGRLWGKVALTRLDVDPGRHVFDEQELSVDLDVVGYCSFDQWILPYSLARHDDRPNSEVAFLYHPPNNFLGIERFR